MFLVLMFACSDAPESVPDPEPEAAPAPAPDAPDADGPDRAPRERHGKGKRTKGKQGKQGKRAPGPDGAADRDCTVRVFLQADADVPVRSKPTADAPVQGKLPADALEVKMDLTGIKDGFAKIEGAEVTIWESEEPEPTLRATSGWVPVGTVSPGSSECYYDSGYLDYRLFAQPDPTSRVVYQLGSDGPVPTGVLGCKGDWVRRQVRGADAWQHRSFQCASRVTTCPGNECPANLVP